MADQKSNLLHVRLIKSRPTLYFKFLNGLQKDVPIIGLHMNLTVGT